MKTTSVVAPEVWRFSLKEMFALIAGFGSICGVIALLIPAVESAQQAARQMSSRNNLRTIGMAIVNYSDACQVLPQATIHNPQNVPLRSWRYAIIPFITNDPLYNLYDQSQPWNSAANDSLCRNNNYAEYIFARPGARNKNKHCTNFVVVTGPGTMFADQEWITLKDVTDDHATTIMLVVIDHSDILWYEPRDMRIDNMSFVINDPDRSRPCIGNRRMRGAIVGMADGSVKFLPQDTPPETLKAMLTIAGGETITFPGGAQ